MGVEWKIRWLLTKSWRVPFCKSYCIFLKLTLFTFRKMRFNCKTDYWGIKCRFDLWQNIATGKKFWLNKHFPRTLLKDVKNNMLRHMYWKLFYGSGNMSYLKIYSLPQICSGHAILKYRQIGTVLCSPHAFFRHWFFSHFPAYIVETMRCAFL